jgi:hypothetical protein
MASKTVAAEIGTPRFDEAKFFACSAPPCSVDLAGFCLCRARIQFE